MSNPNDYKKLIEEWKNDGGISFETRKILSQKVFALMAEYNRSISEYLRAKINR